MYGECDVCGYAKFGNDAHDCVANLKRENKDLRERFLNMENTAIEQVGGIAVLTAKLSALREHLNGMNAKIIHLWFTQSGNDPVDEWFEKARAMLGGE